MPMLILSPRYTPDSNVLWGAAMQAGWSIQRLQNHRAPDGLETEAIVLYGEAMFVRIIAEQLNLALIEAPLDWLPQLPMPYRQREIFLTTLKAARELQKPAFIKPAADKSFDAKIYSSGADLPDSQYFDDETPTLVSEPVEWEIEYRCFVVDRHVETLCAYLRNGELLKDTDDRWLSENIEDEEAAAFANSLLQDETILMPPAFGLDIGKIVGKGWAVIETNPAWGSGIYGNDPIKVLKVLQKACLKTESMPVEFQKWVI